MCGCCAGMLHAKKKKKLGEKKDRLGVRLGRAGGMNNGCNTTRAAQIHEPH